MPQPNGIVIHSDVRICVNCLIFQQVTIVSVNGSKPPKIGGHVDIGTGAKILGELVIGDHAKIGANAVVLIDVPTGKTAIVIPAKITKNKNNMKISAYYPKLVQRFWYCACLLLLNEKYAVFASENSTNGYFV